MEVCHASTPITQLRSAEHGEAPSGSRAFARGSAGGLMKGATATGLLFLPIPLVEAYAKAGLARMQGTVHATYCGIDNCAFGPPQTFGFSRTNTTYVAGVGAQFKAGSLGLRAEYERFNVAGGTPGLASIGATWTFCRLLTYAFRLPLAVDTDVRTSSGN